MLSLYKYQDKLQSERLVTRFLTPDDAGRWAAFFKDEEAVALFPNPGLETPETRAQLWIESQLKRYREHRYGLQALLSKQTKEMIGQCGLIAQTVDDVAELEVGYHVFMKYWGQGFAPEAARLFIDYAFNHQLADSIISIIDIRNIRSQRVAEKNGLVREKQTRWNDRNVFIYRIYP